MADTIFSQIIAKEIPAYIVHEDEKTLAFLDIAPHAKGHTLVIPKQAVPTLLELDEAYYAALVKSVRIVTKKLQEALQPDGFSIGWNHGKAAGQAVAHLHIHIMPRWEGDGGGNMHSIINNAGGSSVEDVHALLQQVS